MRNDWNRFWLVGLVVLVACSGVHAATLTYTTGLQLWLKADALSLSEGNPVSAWADSSSNANDASQSTLANQPTYHTSLFNGLPGLTFDGTNDSMSLLFYGTHALNTTPLTYFSVLRTSSTTAGGTWPSNPVISDSTSGIGLSFGVGGSSGGVGQYSYYNGAGWTVLEGSTTVSNGQPHMLTLSDATFNSNTTGPASLYVDGVLDFSVATNFGNFRSYNSIGGGYGSAHTFAGDIAEVLIYHATLSSTDRQSVEAYLAEKYSIPEPSTLAFAGVGLLTVLARRRSRSVVTQD